MEIVAADIGGTHARFALATLGGGRVQALDDAVTFKVSDHRDFEAAWRAFAATAARPLPRAAAIALAGNREGEAVKLTNGAWTVRPAALGEALGLERHLILNDFAAVAHAVAVLGPDHLRHVAGPDRDLPEEGVISVIGPGTGLGSAMIVLHAAGYEIVPTEGGHIAFAPLDAQEDAMLARLRPLHGRVSVERLVSASGLHPSSDPADTEAIWKAALEGQAEEQLERYFLNLGAVVGDLALAQGASAVVLAGGHGVRLAGRLPASGFHGRFLAKGRFRDRMEQIPVKLVTHPQPGLYGAAAAFARAEQT